MIISGTLTAITATIAALTIDNMECSIIALMIAGASFVVFIYHAMEWLGTTKQESENGPAISKNYNYRTAT